MADDPTPAPTVWVQSPAGSTVGVSPHLLPQYLSEGYVQLPEDAAQQIDYTNRHRGVGEMLKTFGEGMAGTLAPVVGPKMLEWMGDADQLARRKAHPFMHGAGSLTGAALPLLITAGGSATVQGAVKGAAGAAEARGILGAVDASAAATAARLGTEAQAARAAQAAAAARTAAPAAAVPGAAAPVAGAVAPAAAPVARAAGLGEAADAFGAALAADPAVTAAAQLQGVGVGAAAKVGAQIGADASFPSVVMRLGDRVKQGVLGTEGMAPEAAVLFKKSLSPYQRISAEALDQITQGSAFGLADALNRAVLGDPEATAEHILQQGFYGGLVGGTLGAGFGVAGELTKGYSKEIVPLLRKWQEERSWKAAGGIQSDIKRELKGISEEQLRKHGRHWSDQGMVGGFQSDATSYAKSEMGMKQAIDDILAITSEAGEKPNATTVQDLLERIRGLRTYQELSHNKAQSDAFAQVERILKNYEDAPEYGIWGLEDIKPASIEDGAGTMFGRTAQEMGASPQPLDVPPLLAMPNNRGFVQTIAPGSDTQARMPHVATPQRPHEPVQYVLAKLDDAVQSHDPFSFTPNEKYPKSARVQDRNRGDLGHKIQVTDATKPENWDPSQIIDTASSPMTGPPIMTSGDEMVVLAGNGRMMMLKRARRDPEMWAAYKEHLAAQAPNFGFTAEQVMSDPDLFLGRIAPHLPSNAPAADLAAAGTRFNNSMSKELSPVLKAVAEAKNLLPETMQSVSDLLSAAGADAKGKPRTLRWLMDEKPEEFLRIFQKDGVLHQGNEAAWHSKGRLLPERKDYIETVFLARVMGTGERLVGAPPKVVANVEAIAPSLIKIAGANPLSNEIGTIQRAVDLASDAAQRKMTIKDFVAQRSLLDADPDPALIPLAEMLSTKGTKQVQEAFKKWEAAASFDPNQAGMFSVNPTPEQVRVALLGEGKWTAPRPEPRVEPKIPNAPETAPASAAAPTAPATSPPMGTPAAPPTAPVAPPVTPSGGVAKGAVPPPRKSWVGVLPTGFDEEAQQIVRLGFKDLDIGTIHQIRKEMAGKARGWQRNQDPTIRAWSEVIDGGRYTIARKIEDDLERMGLGSKDWKDANFRYQSMRILQDFLDAKGSRMIGNNQLSMWSGLGFMAGVATGDLATGATSAVVAEAGKRYGSALQVTLLKRAADILEGVQARVRTDIVSKVGDIFTAGGAAATASAIGSIQMSRPTDQ